MADFTESEKRLAEKSYYPDGTFAYSMIGPSIISFPFPVQFDHIFLKQHRAPNFYLKKSYGQHVVHGYLGEKLVLSSTVVLFSNMWKQFIPSENGVIIDRLVIPSMIDFDSLLVHIDNLQSYHIAEQSKKSHQAMFFEKIFSPTKICNLTLQLAPTLVSPPLNKICTICMCRPRPRNVSNYFSNRAIRSILSAPMTDRSRTRYWTSSIRF